MKDVGDSLLVVISPSFEIGEDKKFELGVFDAGEELMNTYIAGRDSIELVNSHHT